MYKTAIINTRIDPHLKSETETIFKTMGLSSSEAIRLFYQQVCLSHGLPFMLKVPNKVTKQAMTDADIGNTFKVDDIDDLFNDID